MLFQVTSLCPIAVPLGSKPNKGSEKSGRSGTRIPTNAQAGAENVEATDDVDRTRARTEGNMQSDTKVYASGKQLLNIQSVGLGNQKAMETVLHYQPQKDILADCYGYLVHDDMGKDDNTVATLVVSFAPLLEGTML